MSQPKPISWMRYPLRVCQYRHHCELCHDEIHIGEAYRDGGHERRAHEHCVNQRLNTAHGIITSMKPSGGE